MNEMAEHGGSSFYNSCVKVPLDPCSRQPIPFYERVGSKKKRKDNDVKRNLVKDDQFVSESEAPSPKEIMDNFLKFLESIPDYGQVHHLSNEQFKQKVDYLKKKQKLFLKNLQNSFTDHENENVSKCNEKFAMKSKNIVNELSLNGKKCYLEEFRTASPTFLLSNKLDRPSQYQDLLTNRLKRRDGKDQNICNEELCLTDKNWNLWRKLNGDDNIESDIDSMETRSLPASIRKEWHPTVPKPFNFTLREEVEKYIARDEKDKHDCRNTKKTEKSPYIRRHVRPIPLTSKLPLYNKLLAEKQERSRIIREESALNLMSQMRPFKFECDRRAWRMLTRSSPEIQSKNINMDTKFKAKPVPKNLFSTEIYDRMLEDEYYRQLRKKVRAAQLMKSSSLPPSMARRERVKAACKRLQPTTKNCDEDAENKNVLQLSNNNLVPLGRCKYVMSPLPVRGNNLAAILRCQVSRERLEREIREKMEEKRREQAVKIRESMIGRNPVWRALRSAARHESERDLSIRTTVRRDEAREQAKRHRLQMEMMLNRVMQIPALFERHSQSYQLLTEAEQRVGSSKTFQRKTNKKRRRKTLSGKESYMDYEIISASDSRSSSNFSSTSLSASQSLKSSNTSTSQISEKLTTKSQISLSKKKEDRSQLKVSINEIAELIEGKDENHTLCQDGYAVSADDHNKNALQDKKFGVER
ncbi:protein FAM161A-like [Xylocopa sonorina]|uniref:protein FAM161A-like n=1 Tax=Xylocopa sonorina TaxID=1818115 RepID=UPI00403A9A39